MGKIQVLPENLANQIAAGEVVERPASVVKELVENSIDAGATNIKVQIADGGKKKIRVIDNGEGMSKEDAQLAFKRHATSKITAEDDLHRIKTMGFRGEALSSIAAVSKVTLRSRVGATRGSPEGASRRAPTGIELKVEAGEIVEEKPAGIPPGTDITIKDLFYSVPARQKFLKTTRTESRHITKIITNLALAHPSVGFVLEHNGREMIAVRGRKNGEAEDGTREDRVTQLLGNDFLEKMQPVFLDHTHLKISGWVNRPGQGSSNSKDQYLFVNQRRVDNKTVYGAVRKAFSGVLGRGEYPQFLLFLKINPDLVDVNVHPRKEEVRFVNEGSVFRLVRQTVGKAISVKQYSSKLVRQYGGRMSENPAGLQDASTAPLIYRSTNLPKSSSNYRFTASPPDRFTGEQPEQFQQILQVDNLYLVTEGPDGSLVIYDQHAVHERILYERFLANFKNEQEKGESQELLMAQTLNLSPNDYEELMENKETLGKIGFDLEEFGKNTVKINAVPNVLKERAIQQFLPEFLRNLSDLRGLKDNGDNGVDLQTHNLLSLLACRSAIKAGDRLNPTQAQELLKQLAETQSNYTCPHGRPVKTILTDKELQKIFRRTQVNQQWRFLLG